MKEYINYEDLIDKNACASGLKWFISNYNTQKVNVIDVISHLAQDKTLDSKTKGDWKSWLLAKFPQETDFTYNPQSRYIFVETNSDIYLLRKIYPSNYNQNHTFDFVKIFSNEINSDDRLNKGMFSSHIPQEVINKVINCITNDMNFKALSNYIDPNPYAYMPEKHLVLRSVKTKYDLSKIIFEKYGRIMC